MEVEEARHILRRVGVGSGDFSDNVERGREETADHDVVGEWAGADESLFGGE